MPVSSAACTCGLFLFTQPFSTLFLPWVFVQGFVATLFFGWLPLYLPELFPTRVRATGTGIAYNTGRFVTAVGVFGAGALARWFGSVESWLRPVPEPVLGLGLLAVAGVFVWGTLVGRRGSPPAADLSVDVTSAETEPVATPHCH